MADLALLPVQHLILLRKSRLSGTVCSHTMCLLSPEAEKALSQRVNAGNGKGASVHSMFEGWAVTRPFPKEAPTEVVVIVYPTFYIFLN